MESEIINSLTYNFESVSNQTEDGIHFWFARDLQQLLGYTKWDNFKNVILKAKTACELSNQNILDQLQTKISVLPNFIYNENSGAFLDKETSNFIYFTYYPSIRLSAVLISSNEDFFNHPIYAYNKVFDFFS